LTIYEGCSPIKEFSNQSDYAEVLAADWQEKVSSNQLDTRYAEVLAADWLANKAGRKSG